MALANPFHIPNTLGKSITGAAPKPLPNPWHVPNALGQDITGTPPVYGAPAPAAIAAPVAPPAPDFNALINADPNYINSQSDLARQNQLAMDQLRKNFLGTAQSAQDSANSHGALFSGAAVHAQNYAGQQYADQGAQQAANYTQSQNTNRTNAWQRILQQLAGGS